MKKQTEVAWGLINGGGLIYPSIRATRRETIAARFISSDINDLDPTPRNLRAKFPWLDVVKVTLTWEERGRE